MENKARHRRCTSEENTKNLPPKTLKLSENGEKRQ